MQALLLGAGIGHSVRGDSWRVDDWTCGRYRLPTPTKTSTWVCWMRWMLQDRKRKQYKYSYRKLTWPLNAPALEFIVFIGFCIWSPDFSGLEEPMEVGWSDLKILSLSVDAVTAVAPPEFAILDFLLPTFFCCWFDLFRSSSSECRTSQIAEACPIGLDGSISAAEGKDLFWLLQNAFTPVSRRDSCRRAIAKYSKIILPLVQAAGTTYMPLFKQALWAFKFQVNGRKFPYLL